MLHALVVCLFAASNAEFERGQNRNGGGQAQMKLVQHASDCYTDSDCDGDERCHDGDCEEVTICYSDEECRGKQYCDMTQYICVDPTPSPVTTAAPGCCYNFDSMKSNDKCKKAVEEDKCEKQGCHWMETDDSHDCEMTTTETPPTTTEEQGCCYGDGVKENEMCGKRDSEDQCDKVSDCEWRKGKDADCTFVPTTTTEEIGCCKGLTFKNADMCLVKHDRDDCERSSKCEWLETDDFHECEWTTTTPAPGCCYGDTFKGNAKCLAATEEEKCEKQGCHWKVTDDPHDCEMTTTTTTTTTTTEEPGCCKGDSTHTNPMCNARDSETKCDKSSSCHWIPHGDVHVECIVEETTTEEPGCCYINPHTKYSKKYQEMCVKFGSQRECEGLSVSGEDKCVWEPLGEYLDCEMLWPTTTTTTEEPGCCRGFSFKAQDKCHPLMDQIGCERKGCEWVFTDDPHDCELTTTSTTTTTEEPGCCKGDSVKTNPMCNDRETVETCDRSSSCHWVPWGDLHVDCAVEETTTEEPGCCYVNPNEFSRRWQDLCTMYFSSRDCLYNGDHCVWEPLGEYMDCEMLWPTTTTTTEEPGCCRGYSFKAQAKCLSLMDQIGCERKGCEWVFTEDFDDCDLTTTNTPTTTEEPGCCKGDSFKTNEKCNKLEGRDKCERSSSCHFISWGEVHIDCIVEQTTTEEPGCCYGNPDIGFSKRWHEACTEFYTKRDCILLTNGDGHARCVWEEMNEYEDCAMLWPTTTTTTEEPGCCRGWTFKAHAKCEGLDTELGCSRKDCEWVITDDPHDCEMTTTTTTTTTTTEQPGCCMADSVKHSDMCNLKETQTKCDRSSSCHWLFTDNPHDCIIEETTTIEPGCCYINPYNDFSQRWQDSCTAFYDKRDCEMLEDSHGNARCVWEALGDGYDCAQLWPTTTTTTVEPGCCYGDSEAANSMCSTFDDDEHKCDARGQCVWRAGHDADCTFVPTSTHVEVGCCKGLTRKTNDMCNEKFEREKCEKSGKCEFIETVDFHDCEWDTTTSSPWLGAQSETHSKLKGAKKRGKGSNHAQEAILFGQETAVGQAMQYQVSLSTVLMLAGAALALHQAYKCVADGNGDYKEIDAVRTSTYQTV